MTSHKIVQLCPRNLLKTADLPCCLCQGNEDVRYRGAQNMLKAIQEKAGDEPVVITGDFNANMNETPAGMAVWIYPLVMSKLLSKFIVSFPIKNGDFP